MQREIHYGLNDISVIIPTYKRASDVGETLKHLTQVSDKLCEIIVVDQSPDSETKLAVKQYRKKNIKWLFSSPPAITIARNNGFKSISKKSKIICYIDDDVTIGENYFNEIIRIFNTYPDAMACAVYDSTSGEGARGFDLVLKKIFFLGRREKQRADIVSAYGNLYPEKIDNVINSQWLPGVNMAYKKEVLKEQQFDENLLGYTIAEDIDFSYRLWKKYPNGIYITPFAKLVHRISTAERYPTEKMAYINQIDKIYFHLKNINSTIENLEIMWTIFGIILLRIGKFVMTRKKIDADKLKFFISSLFYCVNNINIIRGGNLRDFLKMEKFVKK